LTDGVDELLLSLSGSWYAVGGRLKAGAVILPPEGSLPRRSLEEPGVGGGTGRGMMVVAVVFSMAVLEVVGVSGPGRRAEKRWVV